MKLNISYLRFPFLFYIRMSLRQLFLQQIAQTSPEPIGLEIVKAKGIYQYAADGKKYLDMISGFSVANIGHSHPKVVEAVQKQAAEYMHLIVYGEFIEAPQVMYASLLTQHLPANLNCVYFTNSGAEATEGAMKLSKRATGRSKIIAFNKSYHGSTQGALSIMGSEYWRNTYRPLLPDVYHFDYNSDEAIEAIDENTACVIVETIQAESGIHKPNAAWLHQLRERCTEKNALLVLDEIQCGFGRTGTLWAFEQYNIVPDILLLGKALGGGMPLGAFIANRNLMQLLTHNPVLGHITTFGGHPVSCAAGKAAMEVLLEENLMAAVPQKEQLVLSLIHHKNIIEKRSAGLWASLTFSSHEGNKKVVHKCLEKGLITDWFLFAPEALRIAPPLIITEDAIKEMCLLLNEAIEEATGV
ncbi:MAG TPA: aspartate aminotransferase family protein [Chitinophagaceae bacterium]|nr:aspartate aminotransferase family protein [Chitinophagaceae bacterium]